MSGKSSGGEVEYLLVANDDNLDSDLEKANKKVKKSAEKSADESVRIEEQKTKDIQKESDKVVKAAEKASDEVVSEWKDAGQDAAKALSKIGEDDVEFDVNANTGKAESKIKAVSKDKSIDVDVNADVSDAEESIKGLNDIAKETGEEIGDTFSGNVGKLLKDSFSDATGSAIPFVDKIGELTSGLSGAQVAAVGAGAAAVGMGALAVGAADDMKGAMNAFLSETGKSREETERYQKVLEDIYANNYGENFTDIAGAMSQVTKQLGDMDDASLQNVTESAFALRDTFEYDIAESTRAAKSLVDNFGVSGEEAMNMIATGAQNGLDYSGELLDSISEYSVQFEKMGFSADDMFNIFQKGAESGAFNLDKVGDAVKEMSIRVIDGSDTTRQGFELLGLNADEMASKFAAGGDTARDAFNQTLDALASIEDPIAQNAAGVDLMGTMWEDLGPEAVSALADIQDEAYSTGEELNNIKDIKYDDLGSQFEELKRNVEVALVPLGESLIPLLSTLAEAVLPVLTGVLAPVIELFAELVSPIVSLISTAITPLIGAFIDLITTAIQPLMPIINTLLSVFSAVMNSLGGTVTSVVNNITNIFRNLIDFVKNVFTGNWRAAWQNIKDIFKNIVSGLANIFKSPINAIIDGINSFLGSLSNIKIPDWVPGVGGKSINISKIPRLKKGLDNVPRDFYPAFLDEGEWVLTKEEANMLRSLGGIEGVLSVMGRTSVDTQKNIVVQGGTPGIDYDALGKVVAQSLIDAGVGFKCDEVVFARLIKDLIDYV